MRLRIKMFAIFIEAVGLKKMPILSKFNLYLLKLCESMNTGQNIVFDPIYKAKSLLK